MASDPYAGHGAAQARHGTGHHSGRGRDPDDIPPVLRHRHHGVRIGRCVVCVAGRAAQTSVGAVFAGMQIVFSGDNRVGDVVN